MTTGEEFLSDDSYRDGSLGHIPMPDAQDDEITLPQAAGPEDSRARQFTTAGSGPEAAADFRFDDDTGRETEPLRGPDQLDPESFAAVHKAMLQLVTENPQSAPLHAYIYAEDIFESAIADGELREKDDVGRKLFTAATYDGFTTGLIVGLFGEASAAAPWPDEKSEDRIQGSLMVDMMEHGTSHKGMDANLRMYLLQSGRVVYDAHYGVPAQPHSQALIERLHDWGVEVDARSSSNFTDGYLTSVQAQRLAHSLVKFSEHVEPLE